MSSFIVTVDTEGDNLWNWHKGRILQAIILDIYQDFKNCVKNTE